MLHSPQFPVQASSGPASLSRKEFPGFAPSSPGSVHNGKQVLSTLHWPCCPGPLPSSPLCSAPPFLMSSGRNGSFRHQPCWLQKARNPHSPTQLGRHRPQQKPPGQLSLTLQKGMETILNRRLPFPKPPLLAGRVVLKTSHRQPCPQITI